MQSWESLQSTADAPKPPLARILEALQQRFQHRCDARPGEILFAVFTPLATPFDRGLNPQLSQVCFKSIPLLH